MTRDPHAHHAPNVRAYLAVFAALAVLTVVTVTVSYLRLPIAAAVFIALAIATVKAGLVAAFFMHLRGERLLIYGLLAMTIFFMGFLFILPVSDTSQIAGQILHGESQGTMAAPAHGHR